MGQPAQPETFAQLGAMTFNTVSENVNAPSVDWVKDIAEMHTKFGVNPVIRTLEPGQLQSFLEFRIDFLQEELDEMRAALHDPEFKKNRADEVVDALIDLCVVAIGTLDAFDVNAHEAWRRVHEKNMQKNPGINPTRINPLGLPDLIKPQNWQPPSHIDNVGLLSKVFEK
ncbi:nucleoside triphosphate pyrophosphohydrolase family protein [Acinetobacter sp.]|uniref:nucleoside triphosphate pyrophosphohydrolase family protein n=1 Tax=Acinetobacter sp. TaxID=472 RepID=UPI00388E7EA4